MENGTKTKNFERWNAADQQLPPAVLGRSSQNLRPALNHNCNSNLSVDWCELVVKASQTLSSLLKPSQTNIAGTHEPNESTPPLPLLGRGGGGTRRRSRAQSATICFREISPLETRFAPHCRLTSDAVFSPSRGFARSRTAKIQKFCALRDVCVFAPLR